MKLVCCIEAFLENLTKKLSFMSKKCFSYQIEPQTAKLSFYIYWSIFLEIDKKNAN